MSCASLVCRAASLGVVMMLAQGALAQVGTDPLRGPEVRTERLPGREQSFGGERGDRQARPIPQREYMAIVRGLAGEDVRAPLRLSREQLAQIEAIEESFWRDMRAYVVKVRGDLGPREEQLLMRGLDPDVRARLTEMAGEGARARRPRQGDADAPQRDAPPRDTPPRDGQRREARDAMDEPMRDAMADDGTDPAELRRRFAEIRRNAPQPGDYQTKIWAVLTPAQQEHVRARLEEIEAEMRAREEAAYMERMAAQMAAQMAEGRAAQAQRPFVTDDARFEALMRSPERERLVRIVRALAMLPDEERDQMLTRIEEALRRRLGERAPATDAARTPDPAPPPAPPTRQRRDRDE